MKYIRELTDDNTIKLTFIADDGNCYYAVIFRRGFGNAAKVVVVVSSQIGCRVGCRFCVGGRKFIRNLTKSEIENQIVTCLKSENIGSNKNSIRIVFAGMGDCSVNWVNVGPIVKLLTELGYLVSIHTPGVSGYFDQMMDDVMWLPRIDLVDIRISGHFMSESERRIHMPGARYPLTVALDRLYEFSQKRRRRAVINYVLFKNKNDAPERLVELAELDRKRFVIKLSVANRNPSGEYVGSSMEAWLRAERILKDLGATVRLENLSCGTSSSSGMGQLRLVSAASFADEFRFLVSD
jgi:23S rRNA (adenine2503-C2)-methyltransferase